MRLHHRSPARSARLLLLLLLLCGAAAATAAQPGLSPHDVARLRTVTDAVISPDGRSIAYVMSVPRDPFTEPNGGVWAELHVTDIEGNSRPFITGQVNVSAVGWTPDGSSITFLAKRSGDKARALYAITLGGGEARRLLIHATDIAEYSFSPDGRQVAFLAEDPVPEERRKRSEKGFNQEIYEEEVQFTRVWIATLGGDTAPRMLNLEGSASELHWSRAGSQLAVTLAPTPLVDDDLMRRRVRVVDVESGRVATRIENPGKLGQVAWSPDGKHLAMISAADLHDPAEGRLVVVPAGGGELRDLLPDFPGHVAAIAWMNNDTVMYVADQGVETVFGRISLSGEQRTIAGPGGVVFTDFTLAPKVQRAAFLGQSPAHPAEVFTMQHGETAPRRLTNVNPWLAERRLAKQEVVRFKARDGLELEGLLLRPLDEKPNTRYPLILVIHGGPEAHYSNGWLTTYSSPGQMAAARGFMVFYPNYRGSTGRGVEFSKLSRGDPAGKEFDDYVDAVDHLVAAGLVDKDKIGITGGSYGGYASAWGATYYSERFAASVMFVGISDEIAKIGATDIPWEMYYVHFGWWPWEKTPTGEDGWHHTLERSPIYHAGKSRTPTLILHGKEDPRVHPSQSLMMYRYLKLRSRAPVRLVWYPGEGHGNRRAAARLDYSLRLIRWMEHYLKGPGGAPPPYEVDYSPPK